jgi:hypothetical protein
MALLIIEGLDRSGKTTVARQFEAQGYTYIHQSAPPKGQTADAYLEEQMQLVSLAVHQNVVLDRSYYGEIGVWPQIFNRDPLLVDETLEILRESENIAGTTRILMHDPNIEAHWKRCVDNKEPLDKGKFLHARRLFNSLADKYGFERKTRSDFAVPQTTHQDTPPVESRTDAVSDKESVVQVPVRVLTPEQTKLETANAINDVLSRRVIKGKGQIYDVLEQKVRSFLNTELGKIFGTVSSTTPSTFTDEEVQLLKFFAKKMKDSTQ